MFTVWHAWIQFYAGALERVCFAFGMRGYSSKRVRVRRDVLTLACVDVCLPFRTSGYSSKRAGVARVDAVLSGHA